MSEIDLIPTAYLRALQLRTWLRRLFVAFAALLLCLGAAKLGLGYGINARERELERLHVAKAVALERKAQLDLLRREKADLQRRLVILSGLRGGVAARHMFRVVDRALDGHVWFVSWHFRRAGELVEKPTETVNTGYFIVVPKQDADEPERAWRLETHMEIRAQANDHSTLAGFVRRLVQQPEIEEVRVLNTRVHRYAATPVVDFELAVVVNSRG